MNIKRDSIVGKYLEFNLLDRMMNWWYSAPSEYQGGRGGSYGMYSTWCGLIFALTVYILVEFVFGFMVGSTILYVVTWVYFSEWFSTNDPSLYSAVIGSGFVGLVFFTLVCVIWIIIKLSSMKYCPKVTYED